MLAIGQYLRDTISRMDATCPRCGNHTGQGTDYASFLEQAEQGELKLFCAYCGVPWQPSPDEQKLLADSIRRHITEN
jgi:hypothetical protein